MELAACRITPRAVPTAGLVPCCQSTYLSAAVISSGHCCLSHSCDNRAAARALREVSASIHSSVGGRHAAGPAPPSWAVMFLPAPFHSSCCRGSGHSFSHRRVCGFIWLLQPWCVGQGFPRPTENRVWCSSSGAGSSTNHPPHLTS